MRVNAGIRKAMDFREVRRLSVTKASQEAEAGLSSELWTFQLEKSLETLLLWFSNERANMKNSDGVGWRWGEAEKPYKPGYKKEDQRPTG